MKTKRTMFVSNWERSNCNNNHRIIEIKTIRYVHIRYIANAPTIKFSHFDGNQIRLRKDISILISCLCTRVFASPIENIFRNVFPFVFHSIVVFAFLLLSSFRFRICHCVPFGRPATGCVVCMLRVLSILDSLAAVVYLYFVRRNTSEISFATCSCSTSNIYVGRRQRTRGTTTHTVGAFY